MPDNDTTSDIDQAKVLDIMRSDRFCMATTVGDEGRLHSHPMTPQEVTEAGDVWFFIDRTSGQAANIEAQKRINLAFSDGSTWLSVAGHGQLVEDKQQAEKLWNSMAEAWFPDGPDSPDLALLLVESDSAEYWDTPGGRVATALSFVKTKLTGERPSGDSDTVDLR